MSVPQPHQSELELYAAAIAEGEKDYTPNAAVQEQLSRVSFVGIIGPMAVGKSTVLERVCELDPRFHEVAGYTTRERRPDDHDKTFRAYLPHTTETLRDLYDKQNKGKFAQHTVHPFTKRVYASDAEDFGGEYNILPVLPQNVSQLKNLAFKQQTFASLVCFHAEWTSRFDARAKHMKPQDITQRLNEGIENLEYSLDNPDTIWVLNRMDRVSAAAKAVIALATEGIIPANQPKLRKMAIELHMALLDEREELT